MESKIISLDLNKFHIISIYDPGVSEKLMYNLIMSVARVIKKVQPKLKFVVLPITLNGVGSIELTKEEVETIIKSVEKEE